MDPQTAAKTRLISDYPIDQVIYRSDIIPVALGSFGFNTLFVDNPLGVPFLPIGQFSLTSDFSGAIYDENSGIWANGFEQYSTSVHVNPDGSNIRITTQNNTAPAVTLYFRIIGLALPGDNTAYPPTSQYKKLVFNTDDNYMKLYMSDTVPLNSGATTTIDHNLGYKPRSLFWFRDSFFGIGMVTYVQAAYVGSSSTVEPRIGDNTITVRNGIFDPITLYYRIYIED